MHDPKQRFTNRVKDYKKYRPSYPQELVTYLIEKCHIQSTTTIADIGSGTGIFTRLLLEQGYHVIGVEPNDAMRQQAEYDLRTYQTFISINGSAEETILATNSIDVITVCQAFHWFDRTACQREFTRILKDDGMVALIWNELLSNTPFLQDYEALFQIFPKYENSTHENITETTIINFYPSSRVEKVTFTNHQTFDFLGVKGRLLSSSHTPKKGQPGHDEIMETLRMSFEKYQSNGTIDFNYQTVLYIGQFKNS